MFESAASETDFPIWIQERLTGGPIHTMVPKDEPGEPPRRAAGQKVFDHLRQPERLMETIRKYYRDRDFEINLKCERIGESRDFAITSNLVNGLSPAE